MNFFKQKFVFTGDEYEGSGIKIKIEREKMKALMKNYKVPDDVVEKFFGDQTTSTETDNGSVASTNEAILTENPSIHHSTSSGTSSSSGNDKGEADDALLEAEAYGLLGLLKLGNITEATLTDNPSGSQK